MKEQILTLLPDSYPWGDQLHYFPQIGSTNDELKRLARQGAPEGTAILAGLQTNGHGRMGRSFHSPEGQGIYLSLLLRPDCPPTELMHLTCAAAVAAREAIQDAAGFSPSIKWTNDMVYGHKKLGGILTELGLSPRGMVDYAIIGIGINCCQQESDFPEELRSMAASLSMIAEQEISRSQTAASLLTSLYRMNTGLLSQKQAILAAYKEHCITLGKYVSILRGDTVRRGQALDMDENGALLVRYDDGTQEYVTSGEVSVRGMYGYL